MPYLKYYFGHDGKKLSFDSVACHDGQTPAEPIGFVKWYEDGDFESVALSKEQKRAITQSESPIFAMVFTSKIVTFGGVKS